MKEKRNKDLTSLLKWKEGIINTIAITNIFCAIGLFNYVVINEELLSLSAERQKELETLQEVTMSLTLRLRERNKQFEGLRQSLKGNWY